MRNENQGGFVFVLCEMAVAAVVAGVELAADKPFPKGRIAGVQRGVPILIPVEEFGVVAEAFGEILFAEALDDRGVVEVGLPNKFRRGEKILFLFPMNGNLRCVVFARRRLRLRISD